MRTSTTERRAGGALALLAMIVVGFAAGAEGRHPAVDWADRQANAIARQAAALYRKTPPDERVTWGGLGACAVLGVSVILERLARVRKSRIIPKAYAGRFHARLVEGKLDRGKALDFCELNPSPASRIVLAAVRRWGRPAADLERGVAMARRVEVEALRKNVGTLRRIAALAPLIGLLGTLLAAHRGLSIEGAAWAPAVARSLATLTAGVALAILSLVAYDGLSGRVASLTGALDRLAAEAVDAIATAKPVITIEPAPRARPKSGSVRREPASPPPSPHPSRSEIEIPLEAD